MQSYAKQCKCKAFECKARKCKVFAIVKERAGTCYGVLGAPHREASEVGGTTQRGVLSWWHRTERLLKLVAPNRAAC